MAPQLAEFASSSRFVVLVPRTGSLEEKVEGFLDWLDSQVRPSAAFVIAPNGETVAERRVDRDVSRLIPMLQRTLEVIEDDDDEPNRRVVFSLGRKGQLHFFEEKTPQGLLACGFVCTATLVDDAISQVRDSLLGSVGPSPLSLPAYDRPRAADLRVPRASMFATPGSPKISPTPVYVPAPPPMSPASAPESREQDARDDKDAIRPPSDPSATRRASFRTPGPATDTRPSLAPWAPPDEDGSVG